jgi:hypothetical protein
MARRAATQRRPTDRLDEGGETVFAPSQRNPTVLSTALLVIGFGLVAALVIWRSAVLIGAGGEGFPQSLTWFDLLAVVAVGSALAAGYRLFNPPVPPARLRLVPARLHRLAGSIAEASVFRVGSLADWTLTNPLVGPEHLHIPGPEESVRAALSNLGQPEWVGAHGGRRSLNGESRSFPPPPRRVAAIPATVPPPEGRHGRGTPDRSPAPVTHGAVQTDDWVAYTTQRGDTYWTLAERLLGQGGRWAVIRDANVGRAVAPDVVLESSMSLRRGWSILVPVTSSRPPSGKGL